ncbi:MAG: ATP-binding cassette domain-containing protein [Sphingobium sp.]|nr:ATP-binding cassette domain-containing protein [Sphingobium sp.]MBP6112653.1 ATP-binding cassette domain-containing protein [Sphingobium sp.]MBP8670544.1 ATP-binding cassette domain-containing protein [Sphingobium sp.]MBP9157659.1 ATP-binding cassette domain-containing protein [Sphingobium sp.]
MIEVALSGKIGPQFEIDVAFEVPAQGVTCLLGPSGSGKTSILSAIAGLERLNGAVRIRGEVWQDKAQFLPPHRRQLGYVFQGGGLLPHLNVARNLDYAARRAPTGSFGREDVIALTGIGALLDRRPSQLSGGETQRASIARVLMSQPRLLLMDEPLSALDTAAKTQLLDHFERLFDAINLPVFYVTHDETEAQRLGARTIRLQEGRLEGFPD